MNASVFSEELEQDGFDPEDFVERLAWRLTGGEVPDPIDLHKAFEQEIQVDFVIRAKRALASECSSGAFNGSGKYTELKHWINSATHFHNLQLLSDRCQAKISRLQNQCREEEEEFYATLEKLQEENRKTANQLEGLDSQISGVSSKVVHLGDQLQSVNEPRAKAHEAYQLIRYFNEFLNEQSIESDIFSDPDKVLEAGGVIQKLNAIAQELPSEKFQAVQNHIQFKYSDIERLLIDDFVRYHRVKNISKMKSIAAVISQFKGYSQCLDAFVEQCQIGAFRKPDVFSDILPLCEQTMALAQEVFANPEQVMGKLVLNIFQGRLQDHVQSLLEGKQDDAYLTTLKNVYSLTQNLLQSLSKFAISSDRDYLDTLCQHLFGKHLQDYMAMETNNLRTRCEDVLTKYYESVGHQKMGGSGGGGFQDIKRDLQSRFKPEQFAKGSLISEMVAVNILEESNHAFTRCQVLSKPNQLCSNLEKLLDIVLQCLYQEHVEYATDLSLLGINIADPKVPPRSSFLNVVRQSDTITHLFEKQFQDKLLVAVKGTPSEESCTSRKRLVLHRLECKINNGLDKLVLMMMKHVKALLADQKRTDFRPETEDQMIPLCSPVCLAVSKYLQEQVVIIKDSLDAQNLELVLRELGTQFHRAIMDHVYQFVYNSSGAMLLICDVNEYKKCAAVFQSTLLTRLFNTLHSLCNLLVVVPENIVRASEAESLMDLDRNVVASFIQLRDDYRSISARIYNDLSSGIPD